MKCIALHGFLGIAADWKIFPFLNPYSLGCADNFEGWASRFNDWAKISCSSPRILLGYSMGGRLALHALIQQPELWHAAILVSTHPGLIAKGEKKERYQADCQWSQNFLIYDWPNLMEKWEKQAIFKNSSFQFARKECDFKREELAAQIRTFSLGLQKNLRPNIQKLQLPLHWITGENDQTFSSLSQEIAGLHARSFHHKIKHAGHRVVWEQPESFSRLCTRIIPLMVT